jgi:hypothetical protein
MARHPLLKWGTPHGNFFSNISPILCWTLFPVFAEWANVESRFVSEEHAETFFFRFSYHNLYEQYEITASRCNTQSLPSRR